MLAWMLPERDRPREPERGLTLTGQRRDDVRAGARPTARSQLSRREDFPRDM